MGQTNQQEGRASTKRLWIIALASVLVATLVPGCAASSPEADFEATPRNGTVPIIVEFKDTSKGDIDSWEWDLDGDGVVDSTQRHLLHEYTVPGCYSVVLTVKGPSGDDFLRKEAYLEFGGTAEPGSAGFHECTPCRAEFTASPREGEGRTRVRFTDRSTGNIAHREWDFDGDGLVDSTESEPSFLYRTNGSYSVTLAVSGPGCENTLTKRDYIRISGCRT